ncbi:MAG: hypothetical protein AB7E47_06935 [Desulfovibrionaceae bacterium]
MIVVVKLCKECPFCRRADAGLGPQCAVSNPPDRPIPEGDQRPQWCRLGKEQVIVREFQ